MLHEKTIYFFFITCLSLLASWGHATETLAERFQNLPLSARGPDAVLRIDTLDTDTAIQRMEQLAGMGFGGVLLTLTTADDNIWDKLSTLANRASELRLELGIQDFLLPSDETPRADDTINVFDEKALSQHINNLLAGLQTRLGNHYGKVLTWLLMKSPPNAPPARPPDLETLFFNRTGFRLAPYLSALDGQELKGNVSSAYVREQTAHITADIWRNSFAKQARDLIQEAGLEAGIMANELLIPPEEAARHFMRPVLLGCSTSATERATNRRIAKGAHTATRRNIMGHLPLERVQPVFVPTQFASKHEMDRLFMDGATRLLLDPGETAWQDETLFTDSATACLYARRWQFILQQSGPLETQGIAWQTQETGVEMLVTAREGSREHIYCIVNDSPNSGSITGVFHEKLNGRIPEYWSPENGEIIPLASAEQVGDTQTSIRFFVEPYGAFFVVFKQPEPDNPDN